MSVPSLSTADFNEEGFFMHTRAIERLALAIQQIGGALGDNNATQGDVLAKLPVGIYDPAKVEIGPNGDIVQISQSETDSGSIVGSLMSSDGSWPAVTATSGPAAGWSATVYPFDGYPGTLTSRDGFPSVSVSGSGSGASLNGFSTSETYYVEIDYVMSIACLTAVSILSQVTSTVTASGGGTLSYTTQSFPYPSTAGNFTSILMHHSFVMDSSSSIAMAVTGTSASAVGGNIFGFDIIEFSIKAMKLS